jgi:hypothetical protein
MIGMVYIKDRLGNIAVIYQKPLASNLRPFDVYRGRDESGKGIYETRYALRILLPVGLIRAESDTFQPLADIERAISRISEGSPEEKYQVDDLYVYSLGEDIANHLPYE